MTAPARLSRSVRRVVNWIAGWASAPPPLAPRPDPTDVSGLLVWCRARGNTTRPHYLWSTFQAARSAVGTGVGRITVIEFGVAGGNGLLELEDAATEAERHYDVRIEVVGFDAGSGMPEPVDHRDVPWVIRPGMLAMDEAALRARLRRSELVIGPVAETLPRWLAQEPAPVGFVALDLDYYSSTVDALRLFDGPAEALRPRVVCYLDDIFGFGWSDFNGERAAIADFNEAHADRKIGPIHGVKYGLPAEFFMRAWPEQLYLAHLFDHPGYDDFEGHLPAGFLDAHRLR